MQQPERWQRLELQAFTVLTVLNLLPFIVMKFFPSMDGASHLSNSNIIHQLLFQDSELFRRFFMLNPEPVPNWTCHGVIALLTIIMPAFLAEKLLIILLLAATPFAFRTLLLTISPEKGWFSFLIFPFTHSMFFFFGFFNFCMAVLLLLVTLNFWLRTTKNRLNAKNLLILSLLVTLTYFSHLVIFGLLLIIIAMHIISDTLSNWSLTKQSHTSILRHFLANTFAIVLASLIPLTLFAWFFYNRHEPRSTTFLSQRELLDFLTTLRPLISFNPILEGRKTTRIFWLLIVLMLIGLIYLAKTIFGTGKSDEIQGNQALSGRMPGFSFWWLLMSMLVLIFLYFTLPEAYGTASYINLRISFIFFIVMILWLSTFRIPWQIGLAAAIISFSINILLIKYYIPTIYRLGKLASECNKAAEYIPDNQMVLPINCSKEWFSGHFVDYLAIDRPILMLYNYECEAGYFPVVWNKKTRPNYYMGNPISPELFSHFDIIKGNPYVRVDYVFLIGKYRFEDDWYYEKLDKILKSDFERVYQSKNCYLYRNRRAPLKSVPLYNNLSK